MKLARAGAFLGTLAVATSASVFFAAPAFAHNQDFIAGCQGEKSTLTIKATQYDKHEANKNTVKVSLDGKEIDSQSFDKNFEKTYTSDSKVELTYTIVIEAWNDPIDEQNNKKWSIRGTKTVPSCVEEEEPPAEQPPAEEPPGEEPPAEQPPAEQPPAEQPPAQESSVAVSPTTTVAPTSVVPIAAEETPLANTGASIAIPLVIGVVLLGGGAALLIMQRRRAARD
ncbi:LPXTG cell wall anchor domain-containing protein [Saccharothrix lopnurensis]|uniref:LPXTG cell wall anchor domain-containing protein n=1 Tax=Saccharothrix lopnurensis TaxID=1670621 RepID=A0ABW1P050_9PSEU